ncbi:response regulator transcription factor [Termitidicoccus mucosus]|uniref:Two-component system response regulator n=1 Tax=Termitidicoccus mucosus TaxID=1184151 RepID=A0A178INT6_9BACT|nr:two-component system response regulator [Opitutaceae bacterium TSB47]
MKLIIIEDQAILRELLVMACLKAIPSAEVKSAPNAKDGLTLCQSLQPAIVLLDIVLPDGDGIDLVSQIRSTVNEVKIIILSSHADEYTLYRSQIAGVNGFVDKNSQTLNILQEAIRTVIDGKSYSCSVVQKVRARVRSDPLAFSKILSEREMELLCLFGRGWSNEEVAAHTRLSPRTARNHRQNIMTKLNLGSTPHLIRYAMEKGFTRIGD